MPMAVSASDVVLLQLASCNYLGVFGTKFPDDVPTPSGDGSFVNGRPIRLVELERGLSNTLLVGERTASQCCSAWIGFAVAGEDAAGVLGCAATAPNSPVADESEFSSRHPGCANFLWADGHVSAISDSVDSQVYQGLAQRGHTPVSNCSYVVRGSRGVDHVLAIVRSCGGRQATHQVRIGNHGRCVVPGRGHGP